MYVNPGDLDKQIQVIRKTEPTYNDEGKRDNNEEVVRSCWAQAKNTSGTELIKAGTEFAEAKKRFLVRYTDTEINAAMVVRYKGVDHNILYVNPYGDNKEYLEIWTDLKEQVI